MILDDINFRLYYKDKFYELTKFQTFLLKILITNKDTYTPIEKFRNKNFTINSIRIGISRLNKQFKDLFEIINKPKFGYKLIIKPYNLQKREDFLDEHKSYLLLLKEKEKLKKKQKEIKIIEKNIKNIEKNLF